MSKFVILSSIVHIISALQSFTEIPTYSEVNPGEEVVLLCQVENKGGECRWEKDGNPVGIFKDKYEWAGDVSSGNCSLRILDSSSEYDDGVWQCQVTASNFKKGDSLISDGGEVVVRAPPKEVFFVSGQQVINQTGIAVNGTTGHVLDLQCISRGGNPIPRIRYTLDGTIMETDSMQTNTRLADGGWESSRKFPILLAKKNHGSVVSCHVEHDALQKPLVSNVELNIAYKPTISQISVNQTNIDEGDSISMYCAVDTNPAANISWKKKSNPNHILGKGKVLVLTKVDEKSNGVYICEAENVAGKSQGESAEVRINFAPVITQVGPSQEIMVVAGKSLTITCAAEGSPSPNYRWLQQTLSGEIFVRGYEQELKIESVNYEHAGQFFCEASNLVGGEKKETLSEPINTEIRGAPVIDFLSHPKELVIAAGEDLEIRTRFCSNPKPVISWRSDKNSPLVETDRRTFDMDTEYGTPCSISILRISSTQISDSGEYILQIENEHGISSHLISIIIVESGLSREILVAIIAGSVLTLILFLFVIISTCKCKKKPKDVESCGTSTTSDNTRNEKLDNSEEDMVFNESYEKLQPDLIPTPNLPARPSKASYNELCFPKSANCGSMRVKKQQHMDDMLNVYNSNILDHINTMSYSNYVSQDNIYHWRKTVDNQLYN